MGCADAQTGADKLVKIFEGLRLEVPVATAEQYEELKTSVNPVNKPKNLIHVVINNGAHETVGGMPTVAGSIDLVAIAKACGYPNAVCVDNFKALDKELEEAKGRDELSLIEVKCSIGARDDLGRPTTTAIENKTNFMNYLNTL